jgi:hypothetical protein
MSKESAKRFNKLISGQVSKTTMREFYALEWCEKHEYEMPDDAWVNQSETHFEAQFLIADIYDARRTQNAN